MFARLSLLQATFVFLLVVAVAAVRLQSTVALVCPDGEPVRDMCSRNMCPPGYHCTLDKLCCREPKGCPGGEPVGEHCHGNEACKDAGYACYSPFLGHTDGFCCPDKYSKVAKCPHGEPFLTACLFGWCPLGQICYKQPQDSACCQAPPTCPDGSDVEYLCSADNSSSPCPTGYSCTEDNFCCRDGELCPGGEPAGQSCIVHRDVLVCSSGEICYGDPSAGKTNGFCCPVRSIPLPLLTCPDGRPVSQLCSNNEACAEDHYCTSDGFCCIIRPCPGNQIGRETCTVGKTSFSCGVADHRCFFPSPKSTEGYCCPVCPTYSDDDDDASCSSGRNSAVRKCDPGRLRCQGRCSEHCAWPLFKPQWSCPGGRARCLHPSAADKCHADDDCSSLEKCCHDGCTKRCMDVTDIYLL